MKNDLSWMVLAIVAGCSGGGTDPIGGHEEAVVRSATPADVAALGVDDDGCHDAAVAGGLAVPVASRPDLVGVSLDGDIVCVTTVEAATAGSLTMSWLDESDLSMPMSLGDCEPQPDPYSSDGDDEAAGDDTEPQPDPYDDGDGKDGDSSDSSDSK